MGLNKYKLGELIELVEETNSDQLFGPNDVRGISNLKEMMSTKANLNGRELSKFQIVRPGIFVFNHRTSRNGSKFRELIIMIQCHIFSLKIMLCFVSRKIVRSFF